VLLFGVRQYGVKIKRRACRLKFATVALFFFANSFKRPSVIAVMMNADKNGPTKVAIM